MASYVSKSACRGHQPLQLASRRLYRRPAITARLLRERSVARFLVAPHGYGKTCIAAEYAETVFGFKHVFWFACENPCFIRDLDETSLLQGVLGIDAQPQLVVFDDLPMLDDGRAACFSQLVDSLIDIGCEVLVCCTPANDVLALFQRDRLLLSACDMLLTDAEASKAVSSSSAFDGSSLLGRVCAVGWGAQGAPALSGFLKGLAKEELPADVALVVFAMMVLGKGTLSDIAHIGRIDEESITFLVRGYPHLGIDSLGERFDAEGFSIDDVAVAFRSKIDGIVQGSRFSGRDALAEYLANLLFKNGEYARACESVRRFCSRHARARWLIEKDLPLVEKACVLPSLDALDSLGESSDFASVVSLACARRFLLLADNRAAVIAAMRPAFDKSLDVSQRMQALVVVARNAEPSQAKRAQEEMRTLLASVQERLGDSPQVASNLKADGCGRAYGCFEAWAYWGFLGQVCLASFDGVNEALDAWSRAHASGADDTVLLAGASWLFGMLIDKKMALFEKSKQLEEMSLFVIEKLHPDNLGVCGVSAASAGLAFERARMAKLPLSGGALQPETMFWLRDMEMSILKQRRAFDARHREKVDRFADRLLTHPDSYLTGNVAEASGLSHMAPLLDVKLFGGMEVRLNGERVDATRISRDKVKTLLAILVLARGREMERDALVRSLWPESTLDSARKNFYTIWSQLRCALELPDGTCPYLIRRKGACSLDARLVRSDVKRFDALCRELRFGTVSDENAREIYRQIEEEFSSELLPGEQKNEIIVAAREDCKAQFLDALINGSANLVRMGDGHQAMWLARSAVRKDDLREDAYQALMNAQIAIGQRTAALMTYLKCKKILSEQLGLDPSPDMEAMYQELLDPGQAVAAKA